MESSASLELAKHALLMFGIILAVGTFSGLTARLLRVPDVVVFLLVGMLVGPSVLGLVDIKADSTVHQLILIFGSSYILFDGGASIRLKVLKETWITIVVISTIGVLITATARSANWMPCSTMATASKSTARSPVTLRPCRARPRLWMQRPRLKQVNSLPQKSRKVPGRQSSPIFYSSLRA